jgi:hypothetical protein
VTHLVLAFRGYRPDSENEDTQREKVGRAEGEEHLLLALDRNDDVAQAELHLKKMKKISQ